MALSFPPSPSFGDTYLSYIWDGSKWTVQAGAGGVSGISGGSPADIGRNLVHNSLFNTAQRGTGPFTAGGVYTLDRWQIILTGSTTSFSRTNLTDANRATIGDEAATYCLSNVFTGTAGVGDYIYIQHPIEDVRRLAGKTVTVSFWANANVTLKLGINLLQSFGTGGSPSSAVWAQTTGAAVTGIDVAFARYSVTIAIPSIAGKTLGTNGGDYTALAFFYSSGSGTTALAGNIGVQSGTINIWGVQLEIGSAATPLEKPDPLHDLAKCQRFYSVTQVGVLAYATAGAYIGALCYFPVAMRAFPTIVVGGTIGADSNLAAVGGADTVSTTSFRLAFSATAAGVVSATRGIGASADL